MRPANFTSKKIRREKPRQDGGYDYALLETPSGWLAPVVGPAGLCSICTGPSAESTRCQVLARFPQATEKRDGILDAVLAQLREYFAGTRQVFDIRCNLGGLTAFSRQVLLALARVPYGETVTYGDLARQLGRPGAARAIGAVMAHNPLPLVFPCHRVIGASGALVGYSGGNGVKSKRWLLDFERLHRAQSEAEAVRLNSPSSQKDA